MTRVLVLAPDLYGPPGGIAQYCRLATQALRDAGVQVAVVALNDSNSDQIQKPWYRPCGANRIRFVVEAIRCLRMRPATILVGHVNFSALAWLLGRLTRAHTVTVLYGVEAWKPLSWSRRFGLLHSDAVLAISNYTATRAAPAQGLCPDAIHVIHPALLCLPAPASRYDTDLSLLTVARVSAAEGYKGHDTVIRAMPALLEQFPHLTYHVVGDGDGMPEVRRLALECGVDRAVVFHGVVSDADLETRYAKASLFVMPSGGEGFGFVFLEAMVRGLPVIGGNADATPEVVVDGETGILVEPGSIDALGRATAALLADAGLRHQMGAAGRRRVETDFTYARFQEQFVPALLGTRRADAGAGG